MSPWLGSGNDGACAREDRPQGAPEHAGNGPDRADEADRANGVGQQECAGKKLVEPRRQRRPAACAEHDKLTTAPRHSGSFDVWFKNSAQGEYLVRRDFATCAQRFDADRYQANRGCTIARTRVRRLVADDSGSSIPPGPLLLFSDPCHFVRHVKRSGSKTCHGVIAPTEAKKRLATLPPGMRAGGGRHE
jgi:hypothetical protein